MKNCLHARISLFGLFSILFTSSILLFSGCQKQDISSDNDLDPVLLNAPELAEYIVAGVEYRHALGVFQAEIEKADLLHLETKTGPNGEKMECLPISVDIGGAYRNFVEKKHALSTKYPQFMSLSKYVKAAYLKTCIKSSTDINQRLLDMGIDINQPETKGGTTEYFGSMEGLINYLNEEMTDPYCKEIAIVVYEDGRIATYIDDANTPTHYEINMGKAWNPKTKSYDYYYPYSDPPNPSDKISYLAHTQQSGHEPSELDKEEAAKWEDLTMKIYHDGTFCEFDENGLVKD